MKKDRKRSGLQWERISVLGPIPKKRKGHSMVEYKNKMYLYGGYHAGDLWQFNPDNAEWKKIEVLGHTPAKRYFHTTCMHGSNMILFGGDSGGNEILNDLWTLDLSVSRSKLRWRRLSPQTGNVVPKPRYAHSSVVLQDTLYIFGGFTRDARASGMYLDELWAYHFPSNSWKKIITNDPKPDRRCYHTAVSFGFNQMIIYGGSKPSHYLSDAWLFDADTQQWRLLSVNEDEHAPQPRAKHASASFNNQVMVISGGYTGLYRESDLWYFYFDREIDDKGRPCIVPGWNRIHIFANHQQQQLSPVPRDSHQIALIGKDLWLFGGAGKGTSFNDTWKIRLDILDTISDHSNPYASPYASRLKAQQLHELETQHQAVKEYQPEEETHSDESDDDEDDDEEVEIFRQLSEALQDATNPVQQPIQQQPHTKEEKAPVVEQKNLQDETMMVLKESIVRLQKQQDEETSRQRKFEGYMVQALNDMKDVLLKQGDTMHALDHLVKTEMQQRQHGEEQQKEQMDSFSNRLNEQMHLASTQYAKSVQRMTHLMQLIGQT